MIRLADVSIHAGEFRLERASFEIPTAAYGMLMGRTGSGKTTMLEAIAGLKRIESGRVLLCGRDVTRLKPAERNIGYVPQDGALFTTMTVRTQIGFALAVRQTSRDEITRRVDDLAELLGIGHLLDRSIHGLSGGERQRIALGRALSFRPGILLLDEPLSALDDETRTQMYQLLKTIQRETRVTTLHVTHSTEEANQLADFLFRVEGGRVVEHPVPHSNRTNGDGANRREPSDASLAPGPPGSGSRR